MKRILAILAVLTLAGCQMSRTDVVGDEKNSRPGAAITSEFEKAPNGTEWFMDMKHTLRGISLEEGNAIINKLMDLGAVDVKPSDIRPDPSDATYASAGSLLIALPDDPAKRKAVLEEVQNRDPQEMPREDIGQRHIKMLIRRGG